MTRAYRYYSLLTTHYSLLTIQYTHYSLLTSPGALPQGADEPDAGPASHRTAATGHAAQEGGEAPLTSTV